MDGLNSIISQDQTQNLDFFFLHSTNNKDVVACRSVIDIYFKQAVYSSVDNLV
jgi:hypothetical protein